MTLATAREYPAHFYTPLGPLCGSLRARHWTLNAAEAECWACRALLSAGISERSAPERSAPLGVLPTQPIWGE